MAAAAPVIRHKTLDDVQQPSAYTRLGDVEKAVVHLLFIFYETYHLFTTEENVLVANSLHTRIDRALKTLYYTVAPAPAGGNDFRATLDILIAFENDEFFKNTISGIFYLMAMNSLKLLFENRGRLPVFLPVAVVPFNGPNIWVAREQQLVDSVSQKAYDAANAVEAAKQQGITLGQEILRRYIKIMNRELRSSIWQDLQRHAEGIPQAWEAYRGDKEYLQKGVTNAKTMQREKIRPSLSRGVKRPKEGGKQSSNRRTMRRQKYRQRRRRTLHRR